VNEADSQELDQALPDEELDDEAALDAGDEPDVLLDVSQLRVDEISLEVDDLRARVALQADVLSLLKLHVGVEAELGRVNLTIKGVEAQALLKVRLDNVARIIERVLTTIDDNPDIVERLVEQAGETAGTAVGEVKRSVAPAKKRPAKGSRPSPARRSEED
jgi:uncharacterized protein involved in outer membrane biogenesis